MKKKIVVLSVLLSLGFSFLSVSCVSFSHKAIHVENTTRGKINKGLNDNVAYSINYEIMKHEFNDVVSVNIETAFNKYKLEFDLEGDIKNVLSKFLEYSKRVPEHIKAGEEKLGSLSLYSFIIHEDGEKERMLINEEGSSELDIYFLLKDGKQYCRLADIYLTPIMNHELQAVKIDSFVIAKNDIIDALKFSRDKEKINSIRSKTLKENKKSL